MSNIIPFAAGSQLPAYITNADPSLASINDEVAVGVQFPSLSIKGKVFALVRDGERKVLTKPDDPDEVLQSIQLNVLRANTKARTYFQKGYSDGDSDGARPTCFSNDGIAPSPGAQAPQANKCAVCPHAVWGSKIGEDGVAREGTECAPQTKLAVTAPDEIGDRNKRFQLRVPPASRKNFNEAVKIAKQRNIPYNALVFKVSFDKEAPSPKLVFKPVGLLSDADYALANSLREDDLVRAIVGLDEQYAAPAAPQLPAPAGAVETDELDAAIAARAAAPKAPPAPAPKPAAAPTTQAKVTPKVKPAAPAPAPAPAPVAAAPAPAPAPKAQPAATVGDDLMAELGSLLDNTDD